MADSQAFIKNLALASIHASCSFWKHIRAQQLAYVCHSWHQFCLQEAMLAARPTNLMQALAPHTCCNLLHSAWPTFM